MTDTTQEVIKTVGKMIRRNLKPLPDDLKAREAFNECVLAAAAGGAVAELPEGVLRVLQSCDRRASDLLPKETSDLLGIAEGKTYRDAINMCEKYGVERVQEEKQSTKPGKQSEKRTVDRRRTARRGGIAEFLRALRSKKKVSG